MAKIVSIRPNALTPSTETPYTPPKAVTVLIPSIKKKYASMYKNNVGNAL